MHREREGGSSSIDYIAGKLTENGILFIVQFLLDQLQYYRLLLLIKLFIISHPNLHPVETNEQGTVDSQTSIIIII